MNNEIDAETIDFIAKKFYTRQYEGSLESVLTLGLEIYKDKITLNKFKEDKLEQFSSACIVMYKEYKKLP